MLASSLHLRRALLTKQLVFNKVIVASIRLTHRFETTEQQRKSLWRDDTDATRRERVIQLKPLNMTCDEQIAMLKRSVDKGVIVGPRQ
jgi:hypothetical protein